MSATAAPIYPFLNTVYNCKVDHQHLPPIYQVQDLWLIFSQKIDKKCNCSDYTYDNPGIV